MKRLVAATISLLWTAGFAAVSTICLFAADRGAAAAMAALHLPASVDLTAVADRPVFAGICFGAAIVSALFATVAITCAMNGSEHLSQAAFMSDMAFGGAAGLAALATVSLLAHAATPEIAVVVLFCLVLALSFRVARWALRPGIGDPAATDTTARVMALGAAASSNVVVFPLRPAAMGRMH